MLSLRNKQEAEEMAQAELRESSEKKEGRPWGEGGVGTAASCA